ncbi:MAG: RAD55 family ATPase [Halococcoides sp.]
MTDAYDISGVLPESCPQSLPAGTNVAVVGPTMTGKRELALELLAAGYEAGNAILCITTESARTVYRDLDRHIDDIDRDRIGIVDASGSEGRKLVDATTEQVSSPGDLTGISIGAMKLFDTFERRGIEDIRYGLVSISTLLQYVDRRTVFKFLHVYTKRIEDTDSLGIYTLDNDSHDAETINTITGQFDGAIEVRETDDDIEVRARGFGRRPTPWVSLPPSSRE